MVSRRATKRAQHQFAVLEPRVQNVPETAIRKKWKKLAVASDNQLNSLLFLSKAQSVTNPNGNAKEIFVEKCVEDVAESLIRKFPRIPFPPRTEEDHFDYEATLQRIRILESQLTSNVHSLNLLRNQIAKEEAMLEQEETELEVLQNGVKSSRALRKQQDKGLHPLARKIYLDGDTADDRDDAQFSCRGDSGAIDDENVNGLLEQFHHHLESMRSNSAGVAEVSSAMQEAQASLDRFTSIALDGWQYERLYALDIT